MQIERVAMARPHYTTGGNRRRLVVLHATAGTYPGDYSWLRAGGSTERPVSIHYLIDKAGAITQFVADADVAWHCGASTWVVDGRRITNCNAYAIGIELSNLNTGADPYPPAQYDAALWLVRRLVGRYAIPQGQLVRHLDIAPGRKTDPAGFPWPRFVASVYTSPDPTAPLATTPAPQYRGRWRLTVGAWARTAPHTKTGAFAGVLKAGTEISGELRIGETVKGVEDWVAFWKDGRELFVWTGQTERIV